MLTLGKGLDKIGCQKSVGGNPDIPGTESQFIHQITALINYVICPNVPSAHAVGRTLNCLRMDHQTAMSLGM